VKALLEKLNVESPEVLASILDAIDDGISIQDLNYRVLYQNDAHIKLSQGSKVGQYCYEAYSRTGSICPDCPVEKSIRDGKTHIIEKITPQDTGDLYIEIKASPLRDSGGKTIGGIEVVRNITRRRRIEKELLATAKRYQTLFETTGDAIFIIDTNGDPGRILAANKAAADMHGYPVPELLTMKISDLDTPESAEKIPQRVDRILEGEQIKFEVDHVRKDGTEFPVEVTAGSMEIDGTNYIFAFDRDISVRKLAEKENEELIMHLRQAIENIRTLHGLLPICAWCKKVRDDSGYWKKVEDYIEEHSHATFTHGICPDCLKKAEPELFKEIAQEHGLKKKRKKSSVMRGKKDE